MSLNFSHTIVRAVLGIFGTAIWAGLCLAAAAGASPIVENPALADTVRVQTVSYADLDLSTPQGRATLNRRVRSAARSVCDIGFFGSADRWLRLAEQRCYHDAVKQARPYAAVTAER